MTHLSELSRGTEARITTIEGDDALLRKLLEMGIEEGMQVVMLHEGLLGRDPLAISINDRIVALRRREAAQIRVETAA
jgi:ferrous iron transport protein A